MKKGLMVINTRRGALVDASAVIEGLKFDSHIGLDVFEQEADLVDETLSERIIQDDVLQGLVTFPNVIVSAHQAYFTDTAWKISRIPRCESHDHRERRASGERVTLAMLH